MNLENNYLAPKKWIKNEKKQLEWVRNYMDNCSWTGEDEATTGIRYFGNYQNATYESIIVELEMKLNSANGIIDLTKMKAAWSQAKYRSKLKSKDKQAYNFVLNTNIKKQLKVLAKQINKPMNETLEDLISGTYDIMLAEKNALQRTKKGLSEPTALINLPYYFDGINYYWSNGNYRGPLGGEFYNTNRTPYFFNGTHFFWYNGLPRQPTIDELYRLGKRSQPIPAPPIRLVDEYSQISTGPASSNFRSNIKTPSLMDFLPSFLRGSVPPRNFRIKKLYLKQDMFPSHVRGYIAGYIGPEIVTPSVPTPPHYNFSPSNNFSLPSIYSFAETNPFSPIYDGKPYLPIKTPINIESTPNPQTQTKTKTRGHAVMEHAEQQHLHSRMFYPFGVNYQNR